jgi:hypothetical protein
MPTSKATSSLIFLIEAFHPDGAAEGAADVLTRHGSARSAPWALEELSGDAVAWVSVRPGGRRRARRRLRRAGLRVAGSWLAVPPRAPRALVPLSGTTRPVRSRIAASLSSRGWRAVLRLPAGLVEEIGPGVGLVVQRADARPTFAWLDATGLHPPVVVSAGWHDPAEGLLLHGEGSLVKSSRPGAGRDPGAEAAALRRLGPAARAAGAAVPRVVYAGRAGRRLALAEEVIAGERVAGLLRRRPDRLAGVLQEIGDWIAGWHEQTRVTRPFSADDLERFVLAPMRAAAPLLPAGTDYADRVAELGRELVGIGLPFSAAHNDLTTWNVLFGSGGLAIVDWEAAEPEALPLVDLDYLIVDAVAAARRIAREEAFARCAGEGADARLADDLRDALCARLDLSFEATELARHACWLGHARNEAVRPPGREARPFLTILRSIAAT